MGSMKEVYKTELQKELELSAKYKAGYDDGYFDGCMDGYDRALADVKKLKQVAAEEMLRGFKGKVI